MDLVLTVMTQRFNIVVASNIGLTGSEASNDSLEESDRNVVTKAKVSDTCTLISRKWGRPTVLALQETGGFDFEPAPFFKKPKATDRHVTTGQQGKGRKGVCTWTNDPEAVEMVPVDNHHEIATLIKPYYNKNGRARKIALLNCYRNIHRLHTRSIEDTITAIRKIMGKLIRDHKVQTFAVFGDFNSERSIDFGHGVKEKLHDKLYHKHNTGTKKTRIDRLFTNCDELEFLDILPTMENKVTGDNLSELGHKTMVFRIGKKPPPPKKELKRFVDMKELKRVSKETTPVFKIETAPDKKLNSYTTNEVDALTEELIDMVDMFLELSKVERVVRERTIEHALWEEIERGENDLQCGKKAEKTFFRTMSNLKNGLADTSNGSRPPLSDLRNKLEQKMSKLNPTDIDTGERIARKIHTDIAKPTNICRNIETFRQIIMRTSNSKARDYLGHSLFHVKKIMQFSRPLLRRLKLICEAAAAIGYFPDRLKIDNIIFIYKNKGCRKDAANWRPITLAPAIGKMFEKYIGFKVEGLNDGNSDNHAYICQRSCQTAITDVINGITNAKIKAKKMNKKNMTTWVIGSPDDISGAFESVDHNLVAYVLGRIFKPEEECNLPTLVRSYLKRKSFVIDENSSERLEIQKTFQDRTTPQGSLLSPLFWRIYDALFTELYKESFERIMKNNENIVALIHVSYADDHKTFAVFLLETVLSNVIIARYMSILFDLIRGLLMDATKQLGCGVNPSKSESIVPPQFQNLIKLEHKTEKEPSDTYKWLGYHLSLDKTGELKFNQKEIENKINSVEYFRNLVFQFTKNMSLRWKVWKVYIAPFVELYLPLVIQGKIGRTTIVHKLQHHTMCRAVGIPITASRRKLEIKVGEKSVEEKAQRLATRLVRCLDLKPPKFGECNAVNTRSGGVVSLATNKAERENFMNKIFVIKATNWELTPAVKFSAKNLYAWVKQTNKSINEKLRRQGRLI